MPDEFYGVKMIVWFPRQLFPAAPDLAPVNVPVENREEFNLPFIN